VVISNGVDLKEFKQIAVGDFYKRFNIPDKKIKLLFVGRLFPEKSIDTLIRAIPHIIAKHKDTHVMIVGGGHLREKLEKLADSLKVRKYITFLGLVSEEDKILAYNAGDIFVMPSLAELEGMSVLEAMACGKPLIISDTKMSASRFFVDGNGFLFKTKNAEDLAEQALKLITNEALRNSMGKVSFKKSKSYDIHQSAKNLEEAYYFVLNKK
jgi:glycosyltransferase involved in cell wall biosynthesis